MVTEDYVSLKTAKLLKERGFDENCAALYHLRTGEIIQQGVGYVFNNSQWENFITAPTLQMAMKWLREVYKINIEIITYWTKDKSMVYGNRMVRDATLLKEIDVAYNSYEEACERAIKYCLGNLI